VWPGGPRRLNAGLYVLMGMLTLPYVPALRTAVGADDFLLLATGGLLYLVSAIVYALRWPNPVPLVFGYHEVFHVFVFSAAFVHFLGDLAAGDLSGRSRQGPGTRVFAGPWRLCSADQRTLRPAMRPSTSISTKMPRKM
jgi:hypothetical protein